MKEGTVEGMFKDPEYIRAMEMLQVYDHEVLGELWMEQYNQENEDVYCGTGSGDEEAAIKR